MLTPDWLASGPVAKVLEALEAGGHQAYVVGGAVRNLLMNRLVKDFDIATSALPDEVTKIFHAKAQVVPTGIDHGTVTVVLDSTPIEITTFRRDVATDGRRAVVRFATSPQEDAMRRDFTMNAIYIDRRGALFDPVGGVSDARERRLRFIGSAPDRIREDYLRSLRFFRLFAEYADPSTGFDPDALDAIASDTGGLSGLSVERVTGELLRLLSAPDPSFAVAGMERAGVLTAVLPGATTRAFFEMVHFEIQEHLKPDPIRRLAAMTSAPELRLSRKEERRLSLLDALRSDPAGLAEIAWRYDAGVAMDVALLRAAGLSEPFDRTNVDEEIALGARAERPISAADLMPELSGAALGEALERATQAWIASRFTSDREELLRIATGKG